MTPTILWAALAATAVLAIGIAVEVAVAAGKARAAAAGARKAPPIHQECAGGGHTYRIHETGWRCVTCGNHVSRIEGELYGLAEEGRIDRRRELR